MIFTISIPFQLLGRSDYTLAAILKLIDDQLLPRTPATWAEGLTEALSEDLIVSVSFSLFLHSRSRSLIFKTLFVLRTSYILRYCFVYQMPQQSHCKLFFITLLLCWYLISLIWQFKIHKIFTNKKHFKLGSFVYDHYIK